MQAVPLQAIPRQQFTITLDGVEFDITLQAVQDCMYATILANTVAVVKGVRCVAGFQLLPYQYLEGTTGNFTFSTANDELPWWQNFGVDQFLIYATAAEVAAARAANVAIR
jgi:hypothetical protein